MKLSSFIIIALLTIIAYHLATNSQQPTPTPAPASTSSSSFYAAPPTPVAARAPAPVVYAPQASPTPSASWNTDLQSTPFDQTGRKRSHWTRY